MPATLRLQREDDENGCRRGVIMIRDVVKSGDKRFLSRYLYKGRGGSSGVPVFSFDPVTPARLGTLPCSCAHGGASFFYTLCIDGLLQARRSENPY